MTRAGADRPPAEARPYQDNAECLADLRQIGTLLLEQVARGRGLPRSAGHNPLIDQAWAVLDARAAASRAQRRFIPWAQLCALFQLAPEEQAALAAAFAADGSIPAEPADLPGLRSWHLITGPEPGSAAFPGGIRLDPVIAAYLQDQAVPRPSLGEPLEDLPPAPALDALPVAAEIVQRIERFLDLVTGGAPDVSGALLLVHGMDEPLLEHLCAAAFARLGLVPVRLDGPTILEAAKSAGTRPARVATFRKLCRDLLLSGRAVVAENLQALSDTEDGTTGILEDLLYTLFAGQKAIAVVNGPGRRLMDLAHRHARHRVVPVSLAVERPDAPLRLRVWRDEACGLGFPLPDAMAAELAAAHPLAAEEIALVLRDAAARRLMEPELEVGELLAECCREQSRRTKLAVAEEIRSRFRLPDIVLPRAGREALAEVLTHVRQRGRVFDEWGFSGLSGDAGGLCVLFHGPSGTGKTMAAAILANELGLGLYKIDLSNVFSKFIGETEKHLAQLFDQAEAMNVVLFFDEAESLFARRTETRDSHDRYANLQTGYLLQRIERYSGIAVLSTNLLQNMDKAFTRRFRFIVEFPFPGPAERSALWRKAFPPGAPCAPDIDLTRLADKLVLSGGNVNAVALSAAFLAASAGAPIGMAHVLKAAKAEYAKLGKVFRWDDGAGGMDW